MRQLEPILSPMDILGAFAMWEARRLEDLWQMGAPLRRESGGPRIVLHHDPPGSRMKFPSVSPAAFSKLEVNAAIRSRTMGRPDAGLGGQLPEVFWRTSGSGFAAPIFMESAAGSSGHTAGAVGPAFLSSRPSGQGLLLARGGRVDPTKAIAWIGSIPDLI
jgi:hypothetical protein